MDIDSNFETYLFLSPSKLSIGVFEKYSLNKIYHKETLNNLNFNHLNFETLDNFLEKNIFEIEKNFKNFVEKIYVIVESNKFLTINISIKKNNYGDKITKDKLIYLLNEAKIDCKKTIGDREITHMIIDNYFIDKTNHTSFPNNLRCDVFSLDLRFICLTNNYIHDLERVLKKYQISINRILNSDYVSSFVSERRNDLFETSMKIIDGYNENEVLIIPKLSKNKGFFERFFNFFS